MVASQLAGVVGTQTVTNPNLQQVERHDRRLRQFVSIFQIHDSIYKFPSKFE
jgi:hypothetical protein